MTQMPHPRDGAAPVPVTIVAHDVGGIGGMERQLEQLVLGLADLGHQVLLIARGSTLPPHPRVRRIRVPGPRRPFVLAYPWFFAVASVLVRRHRRGILHVTGAVVANRADVATVHLCHRALAGQRFPRRSSRHSPSYVINAVIARWLSLAGERWCYRPQRLGMAVGVSRGVGEEIRRCFPSLADRTMVIPNAVDRHAFSPARESAREQNRYLTALFVGSEWEGKGLRFAIEAMAQLPGWRLLVVGRGDRRRYEELAASLGIADRVRFLGPTVDVRPAYQAADAFVLPSAHETFSLVTHEAAASGLPLIATRVGGVEDLLRDGVNGWFVEQNGGDIALRLRDLETDPELCAAMGVAARKATSGYSWEAMTSAYGELYERMAREGERE
jgi:glycosyltransferase involved in cell wall biosynthesis